MNLRVLAMALLSAALACTAPSPAFAQAPGGTSILADAPRTTDEGSNTPSIPPQQQDEESDGGDGAGQSDQGGEANPPVPSADQEVVPQPVQPGQPVQPEQDSPAQGNPALPAPANPGVQPAPAQPGHGGQVVQPGQPAQPGDPAQPGQPAEEGQSGQFFPPGHPGFTSPGSFSTPGSPAPGDGSGCVGGILDPGPGGEQDPATPGDDGRAAAPIAVPADSLAPLLGLLTAAAAISACILTAGRIQRMARAGR